MNNKLLVELEDMIKRYTWHEVLAHLDYLSDSICEATTTVGHHIPEPEYDDDGDSFAGYMIERHSQTIH